MLDLERHRGKTLESVRDQIPNTVEVRVLNACHFAGLVTLEEVAAFGRRNFRRLWNVGQGSLEAMDDLLRMNGLRWAKP